MIINKEIDHALWLILMADKKNSDDVLKFIYSIPNELKEKIRKSLIEFRNTDDKDLTFWVGECQKDNRLYWFEIDKYFQEIDMGYKEHNGLVYRDVFEMSLLLDDKIFDIDYFNKKDIGRIKYNINIINIDGFCNVVEFSENNYYLFKTVLGYMVMYSKYYNTDIKKYYRLVDVGDIPEEISFDSFKEINGRNGLVRRRKK